MAKIKKFRPLLKKFPDSMLEAIQSRQNLIKQGIIVDLMIKRDKAAALGDKYEAYIAEIDKKINALEKIKPKEFK